MDAKTSSSIKVKVTASLDAGLVKDIDAFIKKSETRSRSQLIEEALRRWHKEQKMRELESQIEEYYLSLSDEERQEDRKWNKITSESARQLWEE